MMSARELAHQRFMEFVAAFYRAAECELGYFASDPDSPIAFDVQIDGVKVTVGYDPSAGDANLFAYCVFGVAPAHEEAAVLRRLLERNFELAREHDATYCIDGKTLEVACYLRRSTTVSDVAAFREQLVHMARQALQWRQAYFLDEPDGGRAEGADDASRAPWSMFA